jgi:hypothetical protein
MTAGNGDGLDGAVGTIEAGRGVDFGSINAPPIAENSPHPPAMTQLVRYDAACKALAEAKGVDEVKDIRDKAMAMRLYAKQAKNRQLEADAFEIRLRAERRLGEMMETGKADRAGHGGDRKSKVSEKPLKPTLAEAGIDKNLGNRARKLRDIPDREFEHVISEGREAIERGVERQVLKAVEIAEARKSYEDRKERGARTSSRQIRQALSCHSRRPAMGIQGL